MTSPNLAAPHVAAAQNQKEVTINDAINALDLAITASLSVDCSAGGSVSVTLLQARRNVQLVLTGTPAADFTLVLPAVPRLLLISNTTLRAVTVRNASGPVVILAAGSQAVFYSSGNGVSSAGLATAAIEKEQVYDFGMLSFPTPGRPRRWARSSSPGP